MAFALERGIRLSLCLSVCLSFCVVAPHVPVEMTETIATLLPPNGSDGGPFIFNRDSINKMEDGEKRVFLGEVLEVYDKLIGQMLNQQPAKSQSEGAGLKYLQQEVRRLKKQRYQNQLLVRTALEQLSQVQTNNSVVQRMALSELPWLYHEASSLGSRKRRSLRRAGPRRRACPRPT